MGQPIGLLDIGERTAEVMLPDANGEEKPAKIYAVPVRQLMEIAERFPEARKMIVGGERDTEKLFSEAPTAINCLIAAAFRHLGEKAYEDKAGELSPELQMTVLSAMAKVTFARGGFGPFVRDVLMGMASINPSSPQFGRPSDTTWPQRSPISPAAETPRDGTE